jgi:phage terminase large subunit
LSSCKSHYTVQWDTVQEVAYERTDDYFDLCVPGAGHYFAEGFWHHNTGKTYACLQKLHALLLKYPGSQALMVRRTYKALTESALQTYRRKVLPPDSPVRPYGGDKPEWFDYPGGSRLYVGGLDNPDKVLSSERDFVYVNQAEELSLDDWQTLTTRATGRAGNAPYAQVFGDCNPGPPHHWIKHRPGLVLLESRHEDNPVLYDAAGKLTEQGARTLAVLDALTGVRRDRLRYGRWVSAEGAVYEFDARLHLVDPFPVPADWTRVRSVDFGFVNPFVCLWLALDPDGRLYLYREIYRTGRTVRDHAAQIVSLSGGERVAATVADHDAEDRATLAQCGIPTVAAEKAISPGIQAVEARLARAGDGRPRLFLFRGALVERDESLAAAYKPVCTQEEFDAYQWPKGQDGRPLKEVPLDLHNHSMDALRYGVVWADRRGRVGDVAASIGRAPPREGAGFRNAPPGVFGAAPGGPAGWRGRAW